MGKQFCVVGIDRVTNSPATFTVTGAPDTPAIQIDGLHATLQSVLLQPYGLTSIH